MPKEDTNQQLLSSVYIPKSTTTAFSPLSMTSLSSPSTLNGFHFPSSFKPLFDLEMMKNEAKAATSPQQSQMFMQGSSANQQLQNSAVLQGTNPQQQQQLMQAWISAMQMCREKIATDNSNLNSVLQLLGFSNQQSPAVQKQQQQPQKQNKNKVNELFLSNLLLNQQQKNKSTLESILQQQNNKHNQFQAWAAQLGILANKSSTSDNDRAKINPNIFSRSISNKKPSLCPYTSPSFQNGSNKTYRANIAALSLPAVTGFPQILKNRGSPSTESNRSIPDNDETNTSTISSQEKPVFSTTWDPPRVHKPSSKKSRKRSNGYVSCPLFKS